MNKEELAREKALYLYISAIERGDSDQISAILEQAQFDPALERMIEETHEVYREELGLPEKMLSEEELAALQKKIAEIMEKQK